MSVAARRCTSQKSADHLRTMAVPHNSVTVRPGSSTSIPRSELASTTNGTEPSVQETVVACSCLGRFWVPRSQRCVVKFQVDCPAASRSYPFLEESLASFHSRRMPGRSYIAAPYKLIPTDLIAVSLSIAITAIVINVLVLLAILLRSLKTTLAEHVKELICSQTNQRRKGPQGPTQNCVDDAYEMNVGISSSRAASKPSQRTKLLQNTGNNEGGT